MYAAFYFVLALASACAFYLGSRHQRLRVVVRPGRWRLAGCLLLGLAWSAAWRALGLWGGGFAMLTAFMLAAVALPYLDAWRHIRRVGRKQEEVHHVG